MTEPNVFETMRMERRWPTPDNMRHAADALDILTFAKYGAVLRWFADLCDEDTPVVPSLAESDEWSY